MAEGTRQKQITKILDRERMEADAILLERAARVLLRRQPNTVRFNANEVYGYLGRVARELRQEAERG